MPISRRIWCAVLGTLGTGTIVAITPEDFGYGSRTVNGKPVQGGFPLLVATFELSTNNSTRLSLRADVNAVFDGLVFNFFSVPSVNGYFLENSYGSFYWQRAGVIGPAVLDANETQILISQQSIDNASEGVTRTGLDCGAGIAYLLERIATKTGYNFAQWDANGDQSITQDELSILVVGNGGERSGANRTIGAAGAGQAVGGGVTLRGQVASLDHRTSFMTLTHELSHSLGTVDLYSSSCFGSGLTLMTCTIYPADDDRRTFHLDPWHKMVYGWLSPRIYTLSSGGVITITASQIDSPTGPIILYDPQRGASDYFMVEFRSNQASPGAHHDIHLTDAGTATPITGPVSGMAVWHVGPGNPVVYPEAAPNLAVGGSALWNGQMTPPLRWRDGTVTATRLNPLAIVNGGSELLFEWLAAIDTWVDFLYVGPETGSFAQPFNTLSEGLTAVSHGGILSFKPGTSRETAVISKPMTLRAPGGPVSLGQP